MSEQQRNTMRRVGFATTGALSLAEPHMHHEASIGRLERSVAAGVKAMAARTATVESIVAGKTEQTERWVRQRHPGSRALFHLRPFAPQSYPSEVQERLGEMMAATIRDVFGNNYPLPNKHGRFNTEGLQRGSLLPYLGLIAPEEITPEVVGADPRALLDPRIAIAATSAIVLDENGSGELGRNARMRGLQDDSGSFQGSAVSHRRFLDWAQNKHGLLEMVHTLRTDARAATAHDGIPSSGAVQRLIVDQLGMRVSRYAPLYNLPDPEPFISATHFRDPGEVARYNLNRRVFVPKGAQIEGLRLLWLYQLGYEPNFEFIDHEAVEGHTLARVVDNGPHVYGQLDVVDEELETPGPTFSTHQIMPIAQASEVLSRTSKIVIAKVATTNPASAATQQALLREGYRYCGIEPAQNTGYIHKGQDGVLIYRAHISPVTIHMVRIGEAIRKGKAHIVDGCTPDDVHYDPNLRRALSIIDADIRGSFTGPAEQGAVVA